MKQLYLAMLLVASLLALFPTRGYAQEGNEQSAILGMAENGNTFTLSPSVVYVAVGTVEEYKGKFNGKFTDTPRAISSNPEIASVGEYVEKAYRDGITWIRVYITGQNRGTCTITIAPDDGASCQLTVRVMGPEEFEYSNVCIDGVYYNFDRENLTAEVVKVPEGIEPYKGKVTIPSELEWYGKKYAVTSIGERAFASCNVTSVQLPTSLKQINAHAFTQSNLTYVDITDSVESIGESAFKDCASLASVYLGKGVNTIGHEAFAGCTKLKQFFVSDNSTNFSVNDGVIYDKDFTKLILAPYGKASVSIPATVRSIGEGSFMGNKLIDNIDFPDNLEIIEAYACAGCTSLKQIVIPDKVTTIGDFAFSNCPNISKISLGSQVITVGANAFGDSQAVSKIYTYSILPPMISATSFANFNAKLFVPKGRSGSYANADVWMNFNDIEEFDTLSGKEDIEIEGNDGIVDIHNLQGIPVKRNASKADTESLPAGLYIVGGKKVIVK